MSARVDAVASRVQGALTTRKVSLICVCYGELCCIGKWQYSPMIMLFTYECVNYHYFLVNNLMK